MLINFIDATNDANHYTKLPPVHRYLHDKKRKYLADCCVAVYDVAGRQRLRSAHRRQLDVPQRHQRSTLGRHTFSVAGLIVWNSLPDELRDDTEDSCFIQSLKTLLFSQYWCAQSMRGVLVHDNHAI